ncbi:hypothetical protein B0H14DRAFT_3502716 [Mycena olivaceomarginata]|nr:hypothetical protein B0H14DRAFT_3502716 [Mycena olivaceomarginata]
MRGAQWSEDVEEREGKPACNATRARAGSRTRRTRTCRWREAHSSTQCRDPWQTPPALNVWRQSGDVAVEGRWDEEKEGEEGEQHPAEEREPHLGQGVRRVVEEQEERERAYARDDGPPEATYDDNGNVIPLPLDGPAPGPSKERLAEIRRYDKEQFEKQQRREKRADQGIHTLVRGPGEVMAPVGRPVWARRAPLNANAAQELLNAKLMERFRAKKRKESENAAPAPKNKK